MFRVRRVPVWQSATGGVADDAHYTPFAFANPTRHVLGNLLFTRSERGEVDQDTRHREDAGSAFRGPDLPGFNGRGAAGGHAAGAATGHLATCTTDVVELVETFLYRPLLAPTRRLVGAAKRLQSGRLGAYVYMLVTLVALIAFVVALS